MTGNDIKEIIEKRLLQSGENVIPDFLYGEYNRFPDHRGVFSLKGKWFIYEVEERSGKVICGPFSDKDIIYACAITLNVAQFFEDYEYSEEARKIYRHTNFTSLKEAEASVGAKIIDTKEVISSIERNILNGQKIPHSTSDPVIYKENGKHYLAVHVFFYDREDVKTGAVNRPTMWAIADIETGEIIERRNCRENDFSDAPYDVSYSVRAEREYDMSPKYYEKAYDILDKVRTRLIETGELDFTLYHVYLDRVLANIPSAYRRFLTDLSVCFDC